LPDASAATDLNRKVDVYSDHLFRQVRWEGELLGIDLKLADVPPLAERAVQSAERATATFDRLAPGFERAVAVAEEAPALVASERKAAIEGLGKELDQDIERIGLEVVDHAMWRLAQLLAAVLVLTSSAA
jgi:hypothetical protein